MFFEISVNSPTGMFLLMAIAWTFLSVIAYMLNFKKRWGITIYPLIFIYESKKVATYIEKQAEKNPKIWRIYGSLSGPVTLFFVFVAIAYFAWNLYLLYQNIIIGSTSAGTGSPVVPLIPFITIPANLFITLLIASAIAIIPHEFAHGVVAKSEGVPLQSAGIYVLFGIILGGFVKLDKSFEESFEKIFEEEPEDNEKGTGSTDEQTNDKLKSEENKANEILNENEIRNISKKLYKIASAGLLANLILGLVFFGATIGLFEKGGVLIVNVQDGSPAQLAGLQSYDIIIGINNYTIRDFNDLYEALSKFSPGDNVTVYTDRGPINVTLGSRPDNQTRAYLGVALWDYYKFKLFNLDKISSINLYIFLTISYLLQITVIFLNALPLFVTDGSKSILSYLISKGINPKIAFNIYNLINIIGLTILVANIWLSIGV